MDSKKINISVVPWSPLVRDGLEIAADGCIDYYADLVRLNKATAMMVTGASEGYMLIGWQGDDLVFYAGQGKNMTCALEAVLLRIEPAIARIHSVHRGMARMIAPLGFVPVARGARENETIYIRHAN